nr:kelch repeat-containing protein [bacterium]
MQRKLLIPMALLVCLLMAPSVYAIDTCSIGFEASPTAMPAERGRLGGVVVGEYFYVMGGWDNAGAVNDDLYRYDPLTDTWDDTLSTMPSGLANLCVAALDGKIHAFGGYDIN